MILFDDILQLTIRSPLIKTRLEMWCNTIFLHNKSKRLKLGKWVWSCVFHNVWHTFTMAVAIQTCEELRNGFCVRGRAMSHYLKTEVVMELMYFFTYCLIQSTERKTSDGFPKWRTHIQGRLDTWVTNKSEK